MTTGIRDLEDDIARLEEAAMRAEEATRAACVAAMMLDDKRRELDLLLSSFPNEVVRVSIDEAVASGLEEVGDRITEAARLSHQQVMDQTNKILNLAFGRPGNRQGKGRDLRPMLAEKIRFWVLEQVRDA